MATSLPSSPEPQSRTLVAVDESGVPMDDMQMRVWGGDEVGGVNGAGRGRKSGKRMLAADVFKDQP